MLPNCMKAAFEQIARQENFSRSHLTSVLTQRRTMLSRILSLCSLVKTHS